MKSVTIFYSSRTEPDLLTFYADVFAYLEVEHVTLDIVDVDQHPEKAKEAEVYATPTIISEHNNVKKKHVGIVFGLLSVLEDAFSSKSAAYVVGFKQGKQMGKKIQKGQEVAQLEHALAPFGVQKVNIEEDEHHFRISCEQDQRLLKQQTSFLAGFLSGAYTELLEQSIAFIVLACMWEEEADASVFEATF